MAFRLLQLAVLTAELIMTEVAHEKKWLELLCVVVEHLVPSPG